MEQSGSGEILVIPVGPVEPGMITEIAAALARAFRCRSAVGGGMTVPEGSFNPRRQQYASSAILAELLARKPADGPRFLGVIDEDLYIPRLNFVFGEADHISGVAIISLTRLREEFYGRGADPELFLGRAVKEAVHEIGHSLGLGHCPNPGCVMFFSNRLEDTDRKGEKPCVYCRGLAILCKRDKGIAGQGV